MKLLFSDLCRLTNQLRTRMLTPENSKSEAEMEEEKKILEELMEVSQSCDALVT